MDMIGRIRRLAGRGKKSGRAIARMTGLSRNTVAKWLAGAVDSAPKYRRAQMPKKLDGFEDAIKQALLAHAAGASSPRQSISNSRLTVTDSLPSKRDIEIAHSTPGEIQLQTGSSISRLESPRG